MWVRPSHMFLGYRFFNAGQPNRYKIKRQSKLSTKTKVILLRKRLTKKCQNIGDIQVPSDMGTALIYVRLLSFL